MRLYELPKSAVVAIRGYSTQKERRQGRDWERIRMMGLLPRVVRDNINGHQFLQ